MRIPEKTTGLCARPEGGAARRRRARPEGVVAAARIRGVVAEPAVVAVSPGLEDPLSWSGARQRRGGVGGRRGRRQRGKGQHGAEGGSKGVSGDGAVVVGGAWRRP